MNEIGIVLGEARPERIAFTAPESVRVGDFVTVRTGDGPVLYMVESSRVVSELLSGTMDYATAEEARRASSRNPRDRIRVGIARALGLVDELLRGRRIYPTLPPEPGSSVSLADDRLLSEIYRPDGHRWVEVGSLLRRPGVRVSIDLNAVASRHLAILAITGRGKSNLLALLAKRVAEKNGTMVIIDYHAEYGGLTIRGVKHIIPKLNPRLLHVEELADVLGVREKAERQRAVLHKVVDKEVKEAQDFWEKIKDKLERFAYGEDASEQEGIDRYDRAAALRLLEIIDRALRVWGQIFDSVSKRPIDSIYPNRINVLDVSGYTELQAQILVAYLLEELLEDRKAAVRGEPNVRFRSPVIVALEEAHVFVPAGEESFCSSVIERIAREGRKFGLSLILVSQRPSRLDADVVSQMGSFAISGLTHPSDQTFVRQVTDEVTSELGASLPSLNPGEMILVGSFVRAPALVRVDLVEEKLIGRDIDAVTEWRKDAESKPSYTTEELIRL
ncbi:MAG: ATP-binding protein [Nitrososphaerota archaeon]